MPKHSDVTFASGFDFARRLRDPAFRDFLKEQGWTSGTHVVIAVDDEPVVDVLQRVALHAEERAFIAIVDNEAEFGFNLLIAEILAKRPHNAQRITLGEGASIGMLYSALEPCGTFMPSKWAQEVLFERVPA